ncbi:MAG: hypothetical protein II992_13360 [Lachnospiraceae bacterium]|nr:hypothetical protein [Lachnospiraceae bacterium]
MKIRICLVTLVAIAIIVCLVMFFEQRGSRTADVFDGVLVWSEDTGKYFI